MLIRFFGVLIALLLASHAQALTAVEARAIAVGESDARVEALGKALATADARTAAFFQALSDDAVKVAGDKVFIVRDGKGSDPDSPRFALAVIPDLIRDPWIAGRGPQ